MILMSKAQAQALAKADRNYVAKPVRNTYGEYWIVWDSKSDHWVEFNQLYDPDVQFD